MLVTTFHFAETTYILTMPWGYFVYRKPVMCKG